MNTFGTVEIRINMCYDYTEYQNTEFENRKE